MSEIVVLSPPVHGPSIVIAACRAAALGILNSQSHTAKQIVDDSSQITQYTTAPFGLIPPESLTASDLDALLRRLDRAPSTLVVRAAGPLMRTEDVARWSEAGYAVWAIVTSEKEADRAAEAGVDGLIAKGHEAGGWVGDETTFILLQRLLKKQSLPVWAWGGIGEHTAAACRIAGAAGVVLESQLALTRESTLPDAVKAAVRRMDGSETALLGAELGRQFRAYARPGATALDQLQKRAFELVGQPEGADRWASEVEQRIGWGALDEQIWPLGQDAAFAAALAEHYVTVGGVIAAIRDGIDSHLRSARRLQPLAEDAPLARAHRTRYPIVQGPMTRVSDRAAFCDDVEAGGGLPFLALALLRAPAVEELLLETKRLMGDRAWGVGILGFVPLELRRQQLEVILKHRPPFAIIAGGRPDQAQQLEAVGITTYLHVPSPGLLRLFLKDGARHFIFEGRECGGHVGPRSSFVLWESMIQLLLEELPADASDCHLLFAGGIHDRLSAAMVAAMAAPLVERGVKLGVLMGTAYLFTEEAVSSGAIQQGFQEAAVKCDETVLLESGPGHATRCAPSPFVDLFEQEKVRLYQSGQHPEEIRQQLEELNIGRLRIASKGITRHPQYGQQEGVPKYVSVEPEQQAEDGMYMIGQVAALHDATCTVSELHHEVSSESTRLLRQQVEIEPVNEHPPAPSRIAIVGMSAMLPKAPDLQTFWDNVREGLYAIDEVPKDRWDWELYFDADRNKRDKIYSRWGGFLEDMPFNPLEWGMPPTSLPSVDPMHLLALLGTKQAMADAGYAERPFDRRNTSVILGASGGVGDHGASYVLRAGLPLLFGEQGFEMAAAAGSTLPEWTEDSFAGLLLNVAAGRIANRFDFGGVNYIVDAACASSLTALYLAVNELESGRSDVVFTGGVDTVQNPFAYLCFSKTQALSPTGHPRTFDADGDGIAISEGVTIMMLKRLEDAERDGDRIYAVIQGIAGSSDGRALSMTAPRAEGQQLALERVYQKAGFPATTVGLFEAHGTGTAVGDRTEALALGAFLAQHGAGQSQHAIGSVKSMIGHTKASAGVAGMAKVALALYHKTLPPTLGVSTPNPKAKFDEGPLYINSEARPWLHTAEHPRRAGVSAFGFGGTNFHAVLEEYDSPFPAQQSAPAQRWPAELLLWRTEDRATLQQQLEQLDRALAEGATPTVADLSYTLWSKASRAEGTHQLAIVATTVEGLREQLGWAKDALERDAERVSDPRGIYFSCAPRAATGQLALLFPGQGSQYPNMLRDLAIHFPSVRETIEHHEQALGAKLPRPLSQYIYPPPAFSDEERHAQQEALTATLIAQPALGAVDSAMYDLLEQLGVHAQAVAGHSYGEYVALHVGGAIDATTLALLSEARGRAIVETAKHDMGGMVATRTTPTELQPYLDQRDDLWLANLNTPEQTIIAGTDAGLDWLQAELKRASINTKRLPVARAFHSPLVAPAQMQLTETLSEVEFSETTIPVYSNTLAAPYSGEPEESRALLAEHLTSPVLFSDEIEAMYADGVRIFVEVGPRNVLSNLVRRILEDRPHLAVATDRPTRHGVISLLHALAQLAVEGIPVDLDLLFQGRDVTALPLHALVQATAEPPLPRTTWLVNGGGARPVGTPPADTAPPLTYQFNARPAGPQGLTEPFAPTGPAATPQPATSSAPPPAAEIAPPMPNGERTPPTAPAHQPSGTEGERVVTQFQQLMQQFLGTQQAVMGRYFQGQLPVDAPPSALPQESSASPAAAPRRAVVAPSQASDFPPSDAPAMNGAQPEGIQHVPAFRLLPQPHPLAGLPQPLAPGGTVLITDEGSGLAQALERWWSERGHPVALLRHQERHTEPGDHYLADLHSPHEITQVIKQIEAERGPIAALIHLLPLRAPTAWLDGGVAAWQSTVERSVRTLFLLSQVLQPSLERAATAGGAALVAVSGMGGQFGLAQAEFSPAGGATAGFLKSLAEEWPTVRIRSVDVVPTQPVASLAEKLAAELLHQDDEIEVGYHEGQRWRVGLAPLHSGPVDTPLLPPGSVILLTGGARGITAEIAVRLAQENRPHLILVGRSPLPPPEEATATASLTDPAALKGTLMAQLKAEGQPPTLPEVERRYHKLLGAREIRRTLARLQAAGATVEYYQADVTDEAAVKRMLDELYARHGRLDGVVHGAGIIADKLVADKTVESFDRVLQTKNVSSYLLARHLRPEGLRFLTFFASVAGRFGNRGQSDYAAANETMAKMAQWLNQRWAGQIVALHWGPWQHGMADPSVQRTFAERGLQLIRPVGGVEAFARLLATPNSTAEVVLGNGRWSHQLYRPLMAGARQLQKSESEGSWEQHLTLERAPYLLDHRIAEVPVVPLMLASEWMVEAALALLPDQQFQRLEGVELLRGIKLEGDGVTVRIEARAERVERQWRVTVQLTDPARPALPFYRGTVWLGDTAADSPGFQPSPLTDGRSYPLSAQEAYEQRIFHGPCFQRIARIDELGPTGMRVTLRNSAPDSCQTREDRDDWVVNPFLLDVAPQMTIFWGQEQYGRPALPTRLNWLQQYAPLHQAHYVHFVANPDSTRQFMRGDYYFVDANGALIAQVRGLEGVASDALNEQMRQHQ